MEINDKDRTSNWLTYESQTVLGLHFVTAPTNISLVFAAAQYSVSSNQDAAYASAVQPTLVSYRSRVIFAPRYSGANYLQPLRFGYHIFLRLPSPLKDGAAYAVGVSAGAFAATSFQLAVGAGGALNTNIRVNQVGYPLSGPKLGFVGAWLGSSTPTAPFAQVALQLPGGSGSTFTVADAVTGAVVLTAAVRLAPSTSATPGDPDLYTGQAVWVLDFSALTTPGRYVLRVPGIGVSHAFRVAADALRPVLGALARGMYGQRCGTALSLQYLAPWAASRPEACHVTDAEVMPIDPLPNWFANRFAIPNPTPNQTTLPPNASTGSYLLPQSPAGTRLQVVGGHHDAGDYGKYVVNSGAVVGWLLNILEVLGAEHDNLPLPEAGNGMPDLFEEAAWELLFLEGMQDADGGVFCIAKPNTTAGEYYENHLPCGTPGLDSCNFAANDARRGPRIAWPKDTTCTAQFAAAMARAARSPWFRTFRPADAARYLVRARRAWDYLTTSAPFGAICYHHYGCMGVGDQSHDERLWAAIELYAATGEAAFHNYFLQGHCPRYRHWGWEALPFSYGPATITYAYLAVQARSGVAGARPVNATMAQRCLDELASVARDYSSSAAQHPYGLIGPSDSFRTFGFGWFFPTERSVHLLIAATLAASNASEAAAWRGLAAQQVHYVLGANPQGFSLISGVGARRYQNLVDDDTAYDDYDPPWVGHPIGLASSFSWLNVYGSALGAAFPPGQDYPTYHRISDVFNVITEQTVPLHAQALGLLAVLAGGAAGPALPPPLQIDVQLSTTSGPAPLSVNFQLVLADSENMDRVATIEFDLGDGSHSYKAQLTHLYGEAGRAYYGTVTVVETSGQAVTKSFAVFTSWPAGSAPALPPPAGLVLAMQLDAAVNGSLLPPVRMATSLAAGLDGSSSLAVPANASGGIAATADNLAWQGPQAVWAGRALHPIRFEDTVTYPLPSGPAGQALMGAAIGGLVLEAWLYVDSYLSYGRGNVPLLGIEQPSTRRFFGLYGSLWSGNMVYAGLQTVANETHLGPRLTVGRWHHLRVTASAAGPSSSCAAWVDGQLAAQIGANCSSTAAFDYCRSQPESLRLIVGSFRGYVGGLNVYASATTNITAVCGPKPPPPPPPRPPPAPAADNRFALLIIDAGTIAVLDTTGSCGLYGSTLAAALPLRLYSNGVRTSVVVTPQVAYNAPSMAVSGDGVPANATVPGGSGGSEVGNTQWKQQPAGCSLRIASRAAAGAMAGLEWRLSNTALAAARASGALSIDAKVFVEDLRVGYSFYNSHLLGIQSNWDSYFHIYGGLWTGHGLYLTTPAAATTGDFSGIMINSSVVQAALSTGSWHHLSLTANATLCALSVDGRELGAAACNVLRLLPAAGSAQNNLTVRMTGIRGWVDELRVSSVPPSPRPPSPRPPSPPPPPVDNRFAPLTIDAGTLAVLDTDGSCGLYGSTLAAALPLRLYSNSLRTGVVVTPQVAYNATSMAVSADGVPANATAPVGSGGSEVGNTRWMQQPAGCSLRIASRAAVGAMAGLEWRLSNTALAAARASGALSIDAKVFVEDLRVGYSFYNSHLLGIQSNWDSYFHIYGGLWTGHDLYLATPSAATTGDFSGIMINSSVVQAALFTGSWHHLSLTANATLCALSVDGRELGAAACNALRLLPAAGSAQNNLTVRMTGIRGWVDELRVSSVVRPSQAPLGALLSAFGPRQSEVKLGFTDTGRLNCEVRLTSFAAHKLSKAEQLSSASRKPPAWSRSAVAISGG
ncbi:Endoglucanase D [Tetrabaena socialis]|uniref:cellulase n=1 Tax=Tetrabaena socialis TaxID=47790 RepID=A0A2J7ZZC5_9CHLO|nr:Endoglucanase D [Tetrabaena socialis]|eukprot:PNH05619.1 Endoglucanase D [Tetrabaena socialis]